MHGQIHDCLKLLVLEKFGREIWTKILDKAGCDDAEHFLKLRHYDDVMTMTLIKATAEVIGLSMDDTLEVYGVFFIEYAERIGYARMLRSLGPTYRSFVEHLDTVHRLLAVSYHNIEPPIFRSERREDGAIILHHYSIREGLSHLVLGLLKGAAQQLYDTKVDVKILKVDTYASNDNRKQHHTALVIHVLEKDKDDLDVRTRDLLELDTETAHMASSKFDVTSLKSDMVCCGNSKDNNMISEDDVQSKVKDIADIASLLGSNPDMLSFCPVKCGLTEGKQSPQPRKMCQSMVSTSGSGIPPISVSLFRRIFPYNIIFDKNLHVKDCGDSLGRLWSQFKPGANLHDYCYVQYPRIPFTFHSILEFVGTSVVLGVLESEDRPEISLKGQMIQLNEDHVIFICSPKVRTLNELLEKGVYVKDLAIYDVTREFILLNQLRSTEIDISLQLEETTAALQRTGLALEKEKEKTDLLLHQMLPRKVADALMVGKKVEAEKFEEVTILFSDIVTFTNIAAGVSPMDIVEMLNSLYHRFDNLTNTHEVYKVETIGDAYMVVCGVPDVTAAHAQKMADMALDMIEVCQEVLSPLTKKPIQIRVGVHSGPVVAGVVGLKMPRYCLFGDTVNTASRMESHGVPGKIHLSPTTHAFLLPHGYIMKERGRVNIKGKGKMVTHFLISQPPHASASEHEKKNSILEGQDNDSNSPQVIHNSSVASTERPVRESGVKLESKFCTIL